MPKNKTNAYMCFVMEWKDKHGQSLSVPEAVKRCNSLWSQLSEKQKSYYKEKAKKEPNMPGKLRPKLTSDGTPVDLIEKQQREAARKEEQMIAAIKNTVKHSLNNNKLLDEKFYFISFNFFVRQLNSDIYVPAEVALSEFSLKSGIKRTYHAFTNPKDVLYANVYDAKHHADTTHQLPLPPEAMGDKDLEEIFFDIVQFIQSDDGGKQANYPPLYTQEKDTAMIISCLEYLQAVDDTEMPIALRIYSLEHLFFNLKLAACEYSGNDNVPANKFISDAEFDCDRFEYESNISCLYHEDIDRTKYCPLSKVIRWGYYFADYMGKDVNLNFEPGKHLPDRYNAAKINEDVQESLRSETESVASALSNLSVSSDYNTCDEGGTVSARSSSKGQILPKKVVPTATLIRQNNLSVDVMAEVASVSNHWKRLDMSAAPDLPYFDIDGEESQVGSVNMSRRSYGRGIAVLEDDFPSLASIGRGRGAIKRA